MSSTLQHSPAQIVQDLLINNDLGSDPEDNGDWPIYATNEPNSPDNCITLYDTAGTADGRFMTDGEIQDHSGIQVRVRAKDHNTGWRKANAIRVWLSEVAYQEVVTLETIRYLIHAITGIGDILALGVDAPNTKRSLFTLNCTVPLKQL